MTKETIAKAKRCFMITPIGGSGTATRKHADWVFRYVKNACEPRGIILERADRMAGSSMITTRIFEALNTADVCVADLTGLNANVFYELGVRHSLRLPVIHCAHEETVLPFDNAQHDTVFFDLSDPDSMDQLSTRIGDRIDEVLQKTFKVSNPFTQALGTIEVDRSGDPLSRVVAQMSERLAALERAARPSQRFMGGVISSSQSRRIHAFKHALSVHPVDPIFVDNILDQIDIVSGPTRAALKEIIAQASVDARLIVADVLKLRLDRGDIDTEMLVEEITASIA